jgi:hypothetical protein
MADSKLKAQSVRIDPLVIGSKQQVRIDYGYGYGKNADAGAEVAEQSPHLGEQTHAPTIHMKKI